MIGLFVGFVGKPTPMSGVFEDLSGGLEEDMMSADRLVKTLESKVGCGDANRLTNTKEVQGAGMQ